MTRTPSSFLGTYRSLLLILLLAFIVRTYRITNPIADWHSFRQADTASVTREYVKHGIDLLQPRYQDLSNIQSGVDNLEGYRMVEFPFINAAIAAVIQVTGAPLVVTSRIVSILFSLGTIVSVYAFVKRISDERLATVTSLVLAVLPYSIYYSRVIMPEPAFLFFSCFSLMAFKYWLDGEGTGWYVGSFLALALALLLKPFGVFLAPVYLVLSLQTYRTSIWRQWPLVVYGALAVAPFFAWREWIKQYPSGIPASDWLFNSNEIRFRPAWFRWLFWERITKLMSGYVGLGFMFANLAVTHPDRWVYGSWWVGIFTYFVVIATGNVQHDYYQVLLIPIVCISLARGALAVADFITSKSTKRVGVGVTVALSAVLLLLAWRQIQGYFNVNHWEYVEAGQAVDELLPADAKVIAPAFGDTHFLYQTNRTGWPIGFEIEAKIAKGATHYVTTSDDDEARRLKAVYEIVAETPRYLILDLRNTK